MVNRGTIQVMVNRGTVQLRGTFIIWWDILHLLYKNQVTLITNVCRVWNEISQIQLMKKKGILHVERWMKPMFTRGTEVLSWKD